MTNLLRHIAAIALIALATGCATAPEQRSVLLTKEVKVTTYADMQFTAVALDQPHALTLDSDSPVFIFPEGKSYFAAAILPGTGQPRFLAYQASMSGSLMSMVNVLIPRFAFLDAGKNLLGTDVAVVHHRRSADLFNRAAFAGRVQVPATAAYVVIYASDKSVDPLYAFSANGTKWPVALAPTGNLSYSITTQAIATIADSGFSESGKKAQLFMVTEVDGERVPNSNSESSKISSGTGFNLNTVFTTREVPAKALKLKLVATHITGAPIHGLFSHAAGTFFSVEGVVDFTPLAGGKYVVKGELKKEGSSVWIEDETTGRVVTEKIVAR